MLAAFNAYSQVLTPETLTLVGVGASGKAIFVAPPDCPMSLRVTVQDTNIVTVTPLAAGSVATQIFTVTGLKVGNTAVHIAYSGTSALCPNPGALDLTVHVIEPPAIVQQPAGQSVAVGADVTFTVVATGNLLRYQWRLNGVNLPGATSDTLAITGVQPSDAGDYSVVEQVSARECRHWYRPTIQSGRDRC